MINTEWKVVSFVISRHLNGWTSWAYGAGTNPFAGWLKLRATTLLAAASTCGFGQDFGINTNRNIGPTAADGRDDVRLDQCRLPSSNVDGAKRATLRYAAAGLSLLRCSPSDVDGSISVLVFPA